MLCPAFSGPGNQDEKHRQPKSVGGRSVDPVAWLRLLRWGDQSFPLTAPVLRLPFLKAACAMATLSAVWQGQNFNSGLQWQSLVSTLL